MANIWLSTSLSGNTCRKKLLKVRLTEDYDESFESLNKAVRSKLFISNSKESTVPSFELTYTRESLVETEKYRGTDLAEGDDLEGMLEKFPCGDGVRIIVKNLNDSHDCGPNKQDASVSNGNVSSNSVLCKEDVDCDVADDASKKVVQNEINFRNVGFQILMRMGWVPGEGLGILKEGMKFPLQVEKINNWKAVLGFQDGVTRILSPSTDVKFIPSTEATTQTAVGMQTVSLFVAQTTFGSVRLIWLILIGTYKNLLPLSMKNWSKFAISVLKQTSFSCLYFPQGIVK